MPVTIRKGISTGALSLTPLIDVVFLLLIFFLVASRFEEEERAMRVNLPQASQAEPTVFPGEQIFVTVTPDGGFFIDGQRHDARSLRDALAAEYQANPGRQRVTIRADKDSKTGSLVTAMDACNRAHIRDYTIATE